MAVAAAALALAAMSAAARTEGGGEADALKALKDNPAAAGKAAVSRTTSDTFARTAFAHFVAGTPSLHSPESLKVILGYAARDDAFTTACAHLAMSPQRDAVVRALAMDSRAEAQRLAAGALLFSAMADYLGEARTAEIAAWRHAITDADPEHRKELDAKRKPKAGARRKAQKAVAEAEAGRPPLPIPDALLTNPSPFTLSIAIRAAAYARNEVVAPAVDADSTNDPRVAGARSLYAARLGRPLSGDRLAAAFAPPPRSSAMPVLPSTRPGRSVPDNVLDPLDVPGPAPAVEAIGLAGDPAHLPLVRRAAEHTDPRVRIEAARALRRLGGDEAADLMRAWLVSCEWPVAVELAAGLGERPDARSVPVLIERLRRETGRLRLDLIHALSSIAGEQVAQTAEAWAGWWATNGAAFTVLPEATEAYRRRTPVQRVDLIALGFFYSLPIHSDRICYVVDTSNSMKGGRIASLRRNLAESIDGLDKRVRYNIVDFGGDVVVMETDGPIEDRRRGLRRAAEMPLTGGTRAYDAIERAVRIPSVDTLLFLSDGAPVRGQFNAWPDILHVLSVMHRYTPVAIHSVNFDPAPGNAAGMRDLAAGRAGRNIDVDAGAGADDG